MGSWLIPLLIGAILFVIAHRRRGRREFDEIVFGKLADYETPWLDVELLRVLETPCGRTVAYSEMSKAVDRLKRRGLASMDLRQDNTKYGHLNRWYFTATDEGRRIRRGR